MTNHESPQGWAYVAVSDVAEVNPSHPARIPADHELVSFVPMPAVETMTGRLDPSATRAWREVKTGYKRFQDGDILVAKITPSMENGKAALAHGLRGGVGAGSTEFHVLRPTPAIDARFLLHFILQETFRRVARSHMTGTAGQLRVPEAFIASSKLPIPPLPEQRRIVEAIESYLSRLDAAIAALERVKKNLERYRASVLKAAVEGRLVPTEAELARKEGRDYEPASVLLERILRERRKRWEEAELKKYQAKGKKPPKNWRARYKEPAPPDTTNLPELPEGWCWVSCAQVINGIQTGPFGSSLHKSDYVIGGIPVINPIHIKNYSIEPSEQVTVNKRTATRLRTFLLEEGDIVLGRRGEMGRCAVVGPNETGWLLGTGSISIKFNDDVDKHFLAWVLRSPRSVRTLQGESVGTTMTNLNQKVLLALPIPLPPAPEQSRIVAGIEKHFSIIHATGRLVQIQLARIAGLRQAILKWAFEGRLVDQDPNDEPASVLLERIKAEREAMTAKAGKRGRRRRRARSSP